MHGRAQMCYIVNICFVILTQISRNDLWINMDQHEMQSYYQIDTKRLKEFEYCALVSDKWEIEGIVSSISAITRYIKDHYYGDNKFILLGRHPLLLDYER